MPVVTIGYTLVTPVDYTIVVTIEYLQVTPAEYKLAVLLVDYYTLDKPMAPQSSTDSRGVGSVRVSKARFHELLNTSITSILPTL